MRGSKAKIDLNNLSHNLNEIRNHAPDSEIFAVVKANAYGHGLLEISNHLRLQNVKILAVAFTEEAIHLRKAGDKGEILLIVSGNKSEAEDVAKYNLQTVISDIAMLEHYDNAAKKYNTRIKLHLFLNTGMNRDGISYQNAVEFMKEAKKFANISIVGLLTHFSASEFEDTSFSELQLNRFNSTLSELKKDGFLFEYVHTANSAGIINVKDSKYNAVRPGISLHGYMPTLSLNNQINLKSTLTILSRVLLVQKVEKGDVVGYSKKYISEKSGKIAVIALGYGDGYTTMLSNKGKCLINGKKYNIIGSVCMDQLMVDIENDVVNVDDEAVLLGRQGNEEITLYDLSEQSGLIPYEIFTLLTERLPREYV
jgi:alanine racemase